MKDISLLGCLTTFYAIILGITFACFALIGFKIDGILMFELVGSLTGVLACTAMWFKQSRRAKYRSSSR